MEKNNSVKNDQDVILITASAHLGLGFWTHICMSFADFFGKTSIRYETKLYKVMGLINLRLLTKMKSFPDYDFVDYRIVKDGKLSYVGSCMGIKKKDQSNNK